MARANALGGTWIGKTDDQTDLQKGAGMTSIAARRRNKKRLAEAAKASNHTLPPKIIQRPLTGPHSASTARPTPERLQRGTWAEPQGMGKDMQPTVDLTADMIGIMYEHKMISTSQEQAARLFQELRAAYLAELGTSGYGSCLADNQQGYDGSDGNPAVIAEYRALERKIGRIKTACLVLMTEGKRVDLTALRRALDAVAK